MAVPWVEVGGAIALIIVGAGKSLYNGKARQLLSQRKEMNREERAILEDVHDTVKDTEDKVDDLDTKVETLGETVFYLHEDDDNINNDVFRDRLDVDRPDDFLRGDWDDADD